MMFRIRIPDTHEGPVTGRAYLLMSSRADPQPRLQRVGWGSLEPFFGLDIEQIDPGGSVTFDGSVPGHPQGSLGDVPAGRYTVQGLVDVYELYHRSDGHTIWAPHVGWEGRVFTKTPGNLFSDPVNIDFDPSRDEEVELVLDQVVPPVEPPTDTEWVKRFRIRSALLSDFWGRDMYLGATVLLPAEYHDNPDHHYPVVYVQNHFSMEAAFSFPDPGEADTAEERLAKANEIQIEAQTYHHTLGFVESPEEFYQAWTGHDFPRVLAVTLQHPNPWFDSSHAVDSANNGPYGTAIMEELIPEVERRFRIITEPWARVLTGGSTGGWTSLALQVFNPEFFGGTWTLFPDPIDFRRLVLSDIYRDESMFVVQDHEDRDRDHRLPSQAWGPAERPFRRSVEGQVMVSFREMSRLEDVVGSRSRSGLQLQPWNAIFGPVSDDGYPRPLWDPQTGVIDREVAHYWRDGGYDLSHYIQSNWSEIGPHLVGKLHLFTGEMDNYFLNAALYLLEEFLESTTDPYYQGSFHYGRPLQGHFYQPWTHIELVQAMSRHMASNAPPDADLSIWLPSGNS